MNYDLGYIDLVEKTLQPLGCSRYHWRQRAVHIRGLVRLLWDYAIHLGAIPMQRNPAELIRIEGACKRTRPLRSLTVEEFHQLLRHLEQPFDVMAVL